MEKTKKRQASWERVTCLTKDIYKTMLEYASTLYVNAWSSEDDDKTAEERRELFQSAINGLKDEFDFIIRDLKKYASTDFERILNERLVARAHNESIGNMSY